MKTTVMEILKQCVEKHGDKVALKTKINGQWQEMTWNAYYDRILVTARAFMALGLEQGKAVSILGNNCPQWFISDMAAIFAGAVPGGIYTTNSPEQCHFIAEHSEANIAVVENAEQLAKFKKIRDQSQASWPEHTQSGSRMTPGKGLFGASGGGGMFSRAARLVATCKTFCTRLLVLRSIAVPHISTGTWRS